MAELMKRRPYFIVSRQGLLVWQRFRNVEMIGQHRFGPEESALLHVSVHPRAAALRGTRVVIAQKEREWLTIRVIHFPNAHVGLIYRKIVPLLERHSVELPRGKEYAVGQDMI